MNAVFITEQYNGAAFLHRNDEHPRVYFCTPLITMPYAPLRSNVATVST